MQNAINFQKMYKVLFSDRITIKEYVKGKVTIISKRKLVYDLHPYAS